MLLQDRQKAQPGRPAVNSAVTQDGGSESPSPPTNTRDLKDREKDKMAGGHCMARVERGGVGRHGAAWDREGGAVGGASWEGPPNYTPTSNVMDTPTSPHIMALPSPHDYAPYVSPGPAYFRQHGCAHAAGPRAPVPEAYPPLPPRPPCCSNIPNPAEGTAPVEPNRPEALAKPPAPSTTMAYRQLSIKTSRSYHRDITHSQPPFPELHDNETPTQARPPVVTSPTDEDSRYIESGREVYTPPRTRGGQRRNSNHMLSASAPRLNTIALGDDEETHAFPARTTSTSRESAAVQQIIEAQEKAWRTVHEQATLAGDLELLKIFPVFYEGDGAPHWRPVTYPILKDIKKAITEHDLNSPYTMGLLDSFFNAV